MRCKEKQFTFTGRFVRHWNRLPGEENIASGLPEFQKLLDNALKLLLIFK